MLRTAFVLLLCLNSTLSAETFVIIDPTNSLAVGLSQGKFELPAQVKANPQEYIVICDTEPCTDETIRFESTFSILECGPNETEVGKIEKDFTTADGGLFCAIVPECEPAV